MLTVSFIIANYNYDKFLRQAIESALSSDWPSIEVIVVDDGSTDRSHEIMESFGSRIASIYQKNSRQRGANNAGFAASRGDIIIFLDADDMVHPSLARKVCEIWRPDVSKVQVQMKRVDASGKEFGTPFPEWARIPTADQIRNWTVTTSEYPTPPGSGNAYGRPFLEKFFPVGSENDDFTDSTTLPLAPILGSVLTIREPLVYYRRHGSNDSNLLAKPGHFAREVARAVARQESATRICGRLGVTPPPDKILRRSWYVLQLRVASLRSAPELHPLKGDRRISAAIDAVQNLLISSCEPFKRRLKFSLWSMATLIAPHRMARRLVARRFGDR